MCSRGIGIIGEVLGDGCLTGLHIRTGVCVCVCVRARACSAHCVGGLEKACFMPLHCYCIGTAETSKYTRVFSLVFK